LSESPLPEQDGIDLEKEDQRKGKNYTVHIFSVVIAIIGVVGVIFGQDLAATNRQIKATQTAEALELIIELTIAARQSNQQLTQVLLPTYTPNPTASPVIVAEMVTVIALVEATSSTPTSTPEVITTPTPTPTALPTNTPEPTPTPTLTNTPEPWPITVPFDFTQEAHTHANVWRTIVKVEIYEDKSIWFVEYYNDSPDYRLLGFTTYGDIYILGHGDLIRLATAPPGNARIESKQRLDFQFEFDSPALVPGEYIFRARGLVNMSESRSVGFPDAEVDIEYPLPGN
jgi:type II secretory pathway pseudopilin PulG